MMLKRLIKKIFRKDIIQKSRELYKSHTIEKASPPSIEEQLLNWVKEQKKENIAQLLKEEKIDPRILTPVIIFQSGKVGSTSVHESLQKKYDEFGLSTPVFHAHVLEKVDQRIEYVKATRKKPDSTIEKLLESKELRKQIDDHPEWKWNVISLVRDPVALKVSAFFQLLDEYIPDWQQQNQEGKLTLTGLQEIFFNEKGGIKMGELNHWFDNQVKPIWDIDVYGSPFSKTKGYHIYKQNPSVNFMIIRLEDLNSVSKDAFYDFLGMEDCTIIKTNVGADKAYSDLYKKFKTLPMPADAVNEAYSSRYARHFYTDDEIESFRSKWTLA